MNPPATAVVRPYVPRDRLLFDRLNREWLISNGLFEPPDEWELTHPIEAFIDQGGAIFVADLCDQSIGVCALRPYGAEALEIAKLAVSPAQQGLGVGRTLVQRCLEYAVHTGRRRVVLISNSRLTAALRLYTSMGFTRAPVPADQLAKYRTADVFMERALR